MAEDESESGMEMVPVFSSSNHDGEQEALEIHGLLEANGLDSIVVGPSVIPSLEFQVQVERRHLQEAEKIIAEARETGPAAADEAEAASEDPV